jgi:nitroreductase
MFKELVTKTRSCRKFKQSAAISEATLRELVDLARLGPSAGNLQSMKYMLSWTPEMNARIFPHTAWAAGYKDWAGPEEGQRPAGYIIILGDTRINENFYVDDGIAAQNIVLGAMEQGLGACMIGSIKREGLRKEMAIAERYKIQLIIALGVPDETAILEEAKDGEIGYYRDEAGAHHVPKRPLEEIIISR